MFGLVIFIASILAAFFPYFLIQALSLPADNRKKGVFLIMSCASSCLMFITLVICLMYN
jgi:hypothetical protein